MKWSWNAIISWIWSFNRNLSSLAGEQQLPFCCFFAWPCLSSVFVSCEVNVKHLQCESPNSHIRRVFFLLLRFYATCWVFLRICHHSCHGQKQMKEKMEMEMVEKINCPICQNIWFSLWSNLSVVINWSKTNFLDFSNYKFGFYYFQLDIFTFDTSLCFNVFKLLFNLLLFECCKTPPKI